MLIYDNAYKAKENEIEPGVKLSYNIYKTKRLERKLAQDKTPQQNAA